MSPVAETRYYLLQAAGKICQTKYLLTSPQKLLNDVARLLRGEEEVIASLIDTNILSMFFRGQSQVVSNFRVYLEEYDTINPLSGWLWTVPNRPMQSRKLLRANNCA